MNLKKCKELRRQIKQAFKLPTMHRTATYDIRLRKNFTDAEGKVVYQHYQNVLQTMCPRYIYQKAKRLISHVRTDRWSRVRPAYAHSGRQEAGRGQDAVDGGVSGVLPEGT